MSATSADTIGTRAWAVRTRGALSRREQLQLARRATLAQIAGLPGAFRARLFESGGTRRALLADREPPDSKLTREACELAREVSSRPLFGHCVRCWMWADLFAQRDAIEFDPELLYIACVLHDLALTDAYTPNDSSGARCFAVHGGQVAQEVLTGRGAEELFAVRVAEAITLHMNVAVPHSLGAEAHLLHSAAHLDVAGTRAGDLPRSVRREVVARCPRGGFATEFGQLMRREAAERPRSRAALLWRLGMPVPLAHNPLDRPGR